MIPMSQRKIQRLCCVYANSSMERTRAGANPACLNKLERNEVEHVRRQNGVKRPLERLGWNERLQRMELEWREEKWRKLAERRVIGGGKRE